jgi:uncharacterized repeat protein (TIGR01451 family)
MFKSADKNVAIKGDTVTFTITVFNPGKIPVDKVTVVDNVPLPFIVKGASSTAGQVTVNGQVVKAELGSLPPEGRVEIRVVTVVGEGANGEVINTALLTSENTNNTGTGSATESTGEPITFRMVANVSIIIDNSVSNNANSLYPKLPNTGTGSKTDTDNAGWGWLPGLIGFLLLCTCIPFRPNRKKQR